MLGNEDDYPDTALNPEESAAANQQRALVDAGIKALTVVQTALVRAIYMEGLTYPQLAAQSGLPLATVKSKVRRAILELRAQM